MATLSPTSLNTPQLQGLAERLKAWRAIRQPGQRIPEELWKGAVQLVRLHGLSPTATALKLNYYDLQRRVSGTRAHGKRRIGRPSFIQLAPPAWSVSHGEEGTVELTHRSGARLTLRLPNARPRDLLWLVERFLRHRS